MDKEHHGRLPPTPGVPSVASAPAIPAVTPLQTSTLESIISPPVIRDGFFADANDVFLGRDHLATSDVESIASVESTDDIKKKRNRQSRSTSMMINLESIPERNVILPLKSLLSLMEEQFICRSCRILSNETQYELETFGIASTLHARCSCGHQSSARAILRPIGNEKIKSLSNGDALSNKVNARDFDLNSKLFLAHQLGGAGRQDINNLCGLLDLANRPMKNQLTPLAEDTGISILELANEVMNENLEIEKSFSRIDEKSRKVLSVSNDARWDKRGSGRRYDSVSGCSVMMGNRSKLIVGLHAMSMECSKCKANKEHSTDVCSKNYEGSSKGMESTGAITLVNKITTTEENGCVVGDFVSDDDSSSRAILTHNYNEAVKAGLMTKEEIPRYNSKTLGPGKGDPKKSKGKLPIEHPPIRMLADHGHRNRNHCSPMFGMASKSGGKNKEIGITAVDCERYKRRMGWTLRLFTKGTFEEFKTAVLAVLEHHFDNHMFCGDWCKAKAAKGEEKKKHGFRFRSKETNREMYLFMKELHDKFMDEASLKQLHHQWNTNAVEGFNKLITKFLPKDRNYATTIENKVRIHLAMCLLSLGYKRCYNRLFKKLGLTKGMFCESFFRSEDKTRQWRKQYRQKTSVKKARMALLYKKLKDGREKLIADNKKGLAYSTGMMGPGGNSNDNEATETKSTTNDSPCKNCGKFGHKRKSHSDCDANPKNMKKMATMREIDAMVTVENGSTLRGIEKEGEDDHSDSSISVNEDTSYYLEELAEIEEIEALSFDDVKGIKTTKFGSK